MAEAARDDSVRDIADYLRETIAEIDESIAAARSHLADLERRRAGLAVRLAVIDAATSPEVESAIEEYEQRVAENRPYENAEDATELLSEAHRRFQT